MRAKPLLSLYASSLKVLSRNYDKHEDSELLYANPLYVATHLFNVCKQKFYLLHRRCCKWFNIIKYVCVLLTHEGTRFVCVFVSRSMCVYHFVFVFAGIYEKRFKISCSFTCYKDIYMDNKKAEQREH